MKRNPTQSIDRDSWVHTILGDQNFQEQRGFFAWWYRHTSSPDATPEADFQQRDRIRRSRIAAACMLFLVAILLLVALIAYLGPNKQIANVIYTLYPMIAICIVLNRKGYVNLVGVLLTLGVVGGMCLTLFTTAAHGGLSPNDKDILYLLFFAELFVAAILPINYVFLVAAINILLSIYMLTFAHHTPAFDALLTTGYFSILFRLIQIHVIVTAVLWILVNTNRAAIKRADRAEELARLHHDLATLANQKAADKAVLDHSIAVILATHVRLANGDLDARVPLQGETATALWHIGGQLNNLLGRYQKTRLELQQKEELFQVFQQRMNVDPTLRAAIGTELQRHHAAQNAGSHRQRVSPPMQSV